jgi:hypothetical protein
LSAHAAAQDENARRLLSSQMAEWLYRLNQSQRLTVRCKNHWRTPMPAKLRKLAAVARA